MLSLLRNVGSKAETLVLSGALGCVLGFLVDLTASGGLRLSVRYGYILCITLQVDIYFLLMVGIQDRSRRRLGQG